MQRTFSLIKPDAIRAGNAGEIIARIEKEQFSITAMKRMWLSRRQAEQFYAVHKERSFFEELVIFISSGPVVAMVLQGENAIARFRTLMGATNPQQAASGTLRASYGQSVGENAIHGSDGEETAVTEIGLFFAELEITPPA